MTVILFFLIQGLAGYPMQYAYAGAYSSLRACDNAADTLRNPNMETHWICVNSKTGQTMEPIPR